MKETPLLLCGDCYDKKYEPRYLVVMAGRRYGIDYIGAVLRKHLYIGADITAEEILK